MILFLNPAMRAARLLLAVAVAVLLHTTPGLPQQPPGAEMPEGQIGVGQSEVSDDEIRDRIVRLLRVMDGFGGVSVDVSAGVVTLTGEVIDGTAEETLSRVVSRVEGIVTVENRVTQTADLNLRLAPAVERLRERAARLLANGPILLVALLAFGLVYGLGWLLTGRLQYWERLAPNAFIADIYRTVARIVFAVAGLVIALDILNATALLGAVLGAAGVVGLAVGFAVRDTVENFIASVLLSLRQPFRPDDVVDIEGSLGSVARLTSRATILISPDGNQIRIPNATVYKARIINFTRDPQRRFAFDLGVDADSDLAAALGIGTAALERQPFVLAEPPVSAWVKDVAESSVVLSFTGWVDQSRSDFGKARGEAIRVTKEALEAAGMSLPEPIYRVRMENMPPRGEPRSRPRAPAPVAAAAQADLPAAAAPDRAELATEKVMRRERGAAQENLLAHGKKEE
jgi:small conductance mechanosensitive channel